MAGTKVFNQRLCFISLTFLIAFGGMAIFVFTVAFHSSEQDMNLYKRAVNFFTDKVESIEKTFSSSGGKNKFDRPGRSVKDSAQDKADFPYDDIRLPKDLNPLTYKLTMHPKLEGKFDFTGKALIDFEVVTSTKYVILHSKKLNIKTKKVFDDKKKEIEITRMMFKEEHDLVLLEIAQELEEGKKYRVEFTFRGELGNKMAGFYQSSYKTKSGEIRHLATTQFESTDARAAFPCFDEPEFKAEFYINMIHKPSMRAISNMPAKKEKMLKNGNKLTRFEKSVKMSTYLVAFIVSDFDYTETFTKNGTKVRVWANRELVESTKFALDVAKNVLTYYEEFFNIAYPLPKIDLIAVPDFAAGAMENWGLMTFRETYLLSNPASASAADKQDVAIVVSHELAHQWFGNLVTMKWWQDLWLNEGFANYVEYMGTDHYANDWQVLDQFVSETHQVALQVDSMTNTHPISVPVKNPSQISEIFDTISYNKGSSVIRMLRSFIGEKQFQEGLEYYLKKHAYANAEADDLWEALAFKSKGLDVKAIMDSWILQKGYPVVTIKENQAAKRDGLPANRVAGQQRFLRDSNPSMDGYQDEAAGLSWYVPVTYYTAEEPNKHVTVWMNKSSAALPVSNAKWIKANIHQKGYYRVNYDDSNWLSLIEQLNTNHEVFHPTDRSGLTDDAFALARAGLLKLTTALDLTSYLHNERDYIPWASALGNLGFIGGMLSITPHYGDYNEYIVEKVKPLEKYVGWKNTGSILKMYLRSSILSTLCSHGDKGAVRFSLRAFRKWMKDESKTVSPHLRGMVYHTAIKHSGIKEWEFLWNKYETSIDSTEKARMMYALTGTRDVWLLERLLEYTLDGTKIRTQDMVSVLAQISGHPNGRLLAWNHFRMNFDEIIKRIGKDPMELGYMLSATTRSFNHKFYLNEFKDFVKKHEDVIGKLRATKKAIEVINSNINWMKSHYKIVTEWLQKQTAKRQRRALSYRA